MLALVDRVSETPGRETWHRGVHGGNHRSPGGEDMLSRSQVLQRLVAFLLQMTVVVLLGGQRHTVQRVMGVQPLLLLQRQALQLS